MQRGALVPERVQHVDDDLVTDVGSDGWNGPLPVDTDHGSFKGTVWVGSDPTDFKVIRDGGRLRPSDEGRKQR